MSGKIILFALLPALVSAPVLEAQPMPYYDALSLAKSLDEDAFFTFEDSASSSISILKKYYDGANQRPTIQDLRDHFRDNDFLLEFFPQGGSAGIATLDMRKVQPARLIPAGIGGINVVNFADGLARFLVARTKAEMNIVFFRKFKNELTKKENEAFQILFPQTFSTLLVIDDEIYNYTYYLQSLKASFQKDLSNLFPSVQRLLNLPKYDPYFKDDAARAIARQALVPAQMLADGEHASTILAHLAEIDFKEAQLHNLEGAFKALNLISQSLRARKPAETAWVTSTDLNQLFFTPHAFTIYAGLLYQFGDGVQFETAATGAVTFRQILKQFKQASDEMGPLRQLVDRFVFHGQTIDTSIRRIKENRRHNNPSYQDYFVISQAFLDIVRDGVEFKNAHVEASKNDALFLQALAFASQLNLDVKLKNYGSAIVGTTGLLYVVFLEKKLGIDRAKLLKYGTFMASVAKADTPDDVQRAIEAVALPVGSASIKKLSRYNISLNSYVGGFLGKEILEGTSNRIPNVFGVWAPLGIAFSHGFSKKDNGSLSIFASLIDIGAVTAYRFRDDIEPLPEIQLKNIFAPGVYLNYGLPNVPFSIGGGIQLGPNLRKIPADGNASAQLHGFRISLIAAVDIPILNLFTVTRD